MRAKMLVEKYDLIVFLDSDWEMSTSKNRQHFLIYELARQLKGRSKILGIERPICPWTSPFRNKEKLIKWLRGRCGLRQVESNLYIYTPFVFVHNLIAARIPGMTILNSGLLRLLLRRILKDLKFRTDKLIAWIHHPYQLENVGLVGEKFLVYDCYDAYILSEPNPTRRRDLIKRERTILKQADWVFVSSKELLITKEAMSGNMNVISNGVEFEHFVQAERAVEDSIPQNDGPVVGFTGKITSRLDFKLLAMLASTHPDWKIVMIGPQKQDNRMIQNPDYRAFVDSRNVYLTGGKQYSELPRLMQSFDVCLIPYLTNDPHNVCCSPLKLYEYLATGRPIISTDLPAVRDFEGIIRIAQDREEFGRQITEALKEKDGGLRQRRLIIAKENSWESRVKKILGLIEKTLVDMGNRTNKCEPDCMVSIGYPKIMAEIEK